MLVLLVFFGGTFLVIGGGCGWSAYATAKGIMNGTLRFTDLNFKTLKWCTSGLPFTDKLEKILDGKYIVLLQNNTELRATGGFMGSYVRVNFLEGALTSYSVQDIYQPDGQLPGHVEPPYPVQEAFGTGYWKLRDSNWDPDFASAAGAVKWFLEQGGEGNIKGVVAVNLDFLQKWLLVVGGVRGQTYDQEVTGKNLYNLAQTQAEIGFTPGSTQKRDFLGAVGEALVERTRKAGLVEMIKLAKLFMDELNRKQILLWSSDQEVLGDIKLMKWDGGLVSGWDGGGDYIYVVDSNTGSNKADCCIQRTIRQEIESQGATSSGKIEITWKNDNEFSGAKPPVFWGGDYYDYMRMVVPVAGWTIKEVKVDGKSLRRAGPADFAIPNSQRHGRSMDMFAVEERKGPTENYDLQTIGFWVYVKAGTSATAEITYESGRNPQGEFKEWLKRQPGVEGFNYELMIDGKIQTNNFIDKDNLLKIHY